LEDARKTRKLRDLGGGMARLPALTPRASHWPGANEAIPAHHADGAQLGPEDVSDPE